MNCVYISADYFYPAVLDELKDTGSWFIGEYLNLHGWNIPFNDMKFERKI